MVGDRILKEDHDSNGMSDEIFISHCAEKSHELPN